LQKVPAFVLLLELLTLDFEEHHAKHILLASALGVDKSVQVGDGDLVGNHVQVLVGRLALRELFVVGVRSVLGLRGCLRNRLLFFNGNGIGFGFDFVNLSHQVALDVVLELLLQPQSVVGPLLADHRDLWVDSASLVA